MLINAGIAGSCGAAAVLSSERRQGRFAGGRPRRKQPLPRTAVLHGGVTSAGRGTLSTRKERRAALEAVGMLTNNNNNSNNTAHFVGAEGMYKRSTGRSQDCKKIFFLNIR